MEKKLTCIMCPMGCELTITKENEEIKVCGNGCIRGQRYGISEITNPTRIITTLIKTQNGLVSVKTSNLVPKDKIFDAVAEIHSINATNVSVGQIIKKNLLGLPGVDVVVTRTELEI